MLALCMTGCGGGSGSQTPPSAALSSDQQIYQQVELGGGESTLSWSFPFGGGTLVSGANYIFSTTTALSHSPATGPQTQAPALNSLFSSIVIPSSAPTLTRVLIGGQVLLAPANATQLITYSGTGIRRDRYAEDGVTVVDSALFFNYSSIPLTGSMTASPAELLAAFPIGNWVNLDVFTGGTSWQPGAAYIKSSGQRIGDTVFVADCTGNTTTADINPCASGTTLDNFFPYTFQSTNNQHPVENDFAGDGSISTIQGVTMWVSTSPLPLESSSTSVYRVLGDTVDDLNVFSAYYGLPQCNDSNPCFRQIDLSNGATGDDDWGNEMAIDTQMVHAIAPGANIVLVIANSGSESDLMAAVQAAASVSGVTAVSMSFSWSETADELTAYDPIFAQHPGVIFFGASGDWGAYSPSPAALLPYSGGGYPAMSPYVTAVGGTRLQSIAWTGPASEIAWQFSSGGASLFEPMPAWQTTYLSGSPVLALNNGMRAIPDVSALADFEHSAFGVYHRLAWHSDGGTSSATPLWAGLAALLGQKMANEGKSLSALVQATPGGFNGLLYQTQLTQGTTAGFYAVTSGSNNLTVTPCSRCSAGPGYSDVTGLGAPNFTGLLSHF